jgi:tyrosyl-tRNA synthetase
VDKFDSLRQAFDRTTQEVISETEWLSALASGRKLRVKYGVDVTAPHLHIGHAVNLWMMRRLQDMGHCVIFLIGDFTTQIGDPTGKNKLRPVISKEEIEKNVGAFSEQAKMVLRFDDPELLEIRRNSEWYDNMKLPEFLRLVSLVTHARLVSRDMFQKRIGEGTDIFMHEMLYPILQGFDSFKLDADLTIIGSDQLFNEMMGRFFQEKFGQRPQVIITTKITPGIDGKAKQSKSLGNYVGLGHSPRDKFGRLMSVPDHLIREFVVVYTDLEGDELEQIKSLTESDPFEAKKRMAAAITARYHGAEVARAERKWFEEVFSARQVPADIPEITLGEPTLGILTLLRLCFGTSRTGNELRRLIEQGAVTINGERVTDFRAMVSPKRGDVLRTGKQGWFRIG